MPARVPVSETAAADEEVPTLHVSPPSALPGPDPAGQAIPVHVVGGGAAVGVVIDVGRVEAAVVAVLIVVALVVVVVKA